MERGACLGRPLHIRLESLGGRREVRLETVFV